MLFKNQTIVITGGASGIGLAVAKKVSANAGTALIIDKNLKQLNSIELNRSANFKISHSDVSNEDQLNEALKEHSKSCPPITGLVCSAGKAPIPKKIVCLLQPI